LPEGLTSLSTRLVPYQSLSRRVHTVPHYPFPFYRSERKTWFVEINKRQLNLGKHPAGLPVPEKDEHGRWVPPPAIMREYHRRMAEEDDAPAPVQPEGKFVVEILEEFMEQYASEKAPRTY